MEFAIRTLDASSAGSNKLLACKIRAPISDSGILLLSPY